MIMIFSIILSVFAVNFIIWGIPAGVRVFESKGIFKLMRLHRSVWWGEMLILGSVLVLAMLSFLAALFGTHMGVVWLRDREDGVKHLVRHQFMCSYAQGLKFVVINSSTASSPEFTCTCATDCVHHSLCYPPVMGSAVLSGRAIYLCCL